IAMIAGTITAVAGAIAAVVALLPHHSPSPPAQPTITNVIRLSPQERRKVDRVRSDDWPGGPGYSAILASRTSEAEARAVQRQASDRGLDAGVLFSSNFRSLRRGFWVVFSGTFSSNPLAIRRADRAQ